MEIETRNYPGVALLRSYWGQILNDCFLVGQGTSRNFQVGNKKGDREGGGGGGGNGDRQENLYASRGV